MSATTIKAELASLGEKSPTVVLCIRLIEFVEGLPQDQRSMLTYRTFTHAAGKEKIDHEIISAVTLLASNRIHAFDLYGLFIDDDNHEYEISSDDIREAHRTGELIHPHTGKPVDNFEDKVIPFFAPSSQFLAAE